MSIDRLFDEFVERREVAIDAEVIPDNPCQEFRDTPRQKAEEALESTRADISRWLG